MKHTRVSLLALSALAGGVFIASAADVGTNYVLNAQFTNNPPARLVDVWGLPAFGLNLFKGGYYGAIQTDGGGKIDGVQDMAVRFLTDLGPFNKGSFIVDVSGSIKSSGNPPVPMAKMSIKGNGYVENNAGTTQSVASLNYKFTGNGGITFQSSTTGSVVPASGSSLYYVPIVYLNSDGTTNYTSSYYPSATYYYRPPSTTVEFNYFETEIQTNSLGATNSYNQWNWRYDADDSDTFGTPIGAAVGTNTLGTNSFPRYRIGYDAYFDYNWTGTNYSWYWTTNYQNGYDIAQRAAYVAAYINYNSAYITNTAEGYFDNWTYTTTTIPNDGYTNYSDQTYLSNRWGEVVGTVKGSLKAGKYEHSFNGQTARFSESHNVYALVSNTNHNYITVMQFDSNAGIHDINGLSAAVVTFGKKLWLSDPDGSGWDFSGTGSLDPKKSTFKASLKGVASSHSSSLDINGSTTNVIIGFTALTNVVTFDNFLANPTVAVTGTSTTGTNYADYGRVGWSPETVGPRTNVIGGTNQFITRSDWEVYVPALIRTNAVPNGIRTITASGKMMGQKVPTIKGVNPNADFND